MRKHIPNIITLLNLLCGILSIFSLLYLHKPVLASLFIILGAVMDFFDGMSARLLKVASPIGKELDSLSDVVSFGVAPSFIACYVLLVKDCNIFFSLIPLLMALLSSYRLAKFNLDSRQRDNFIGLATPANAFIWLSIPLIHFLCEKGISLWFVKDNGEFFCSLYNIVSSAYFIVPISLICSWLLVAEIPMFSLKFHSLKWADNKIRFIFIISSVLLLILFYWGAIPVIILLYIILSIINNIINKKDNEIRG